MRTIKIRFVKNKTGSYYIQRKGWFGRWKYIGYTVDMGYGGYYALYIGDTKEALLDEVLDKHYQVCRNHVEIMEYPMIKLH
jgi:hypothetical protein